MNKSKQKIRHVDTYLILFIATLTGLKFVGTKIKWRLKKSVKLNKMESRYCRPWKKASDAVIL